MEYKKLENRQCLGKRINELREIQGLTTCDLAELTGLRESNIKRIELGKYSVDIDLLGNIADALNCKIDFVQKTLKQCEYTFI